MSRPQLILRKINMENENQSDITLKEMIKLAHEVEQWELEGDPRHEIYRGHVNADFDVVITPDDERHNYRMFAYYKGAWIGEVEDSCLHNLFSLAGENYGLRTRQLRNEGRKKLREMIG